MYFYLSSPCELHTLLGPSLNYNSIMAGSLGSQIYSGHHEIRREHLSIYSRKMQLNVFAIASMRTSFHGQGSFDRE